MPLLNLSHMQFQRLIHSFYHDACAPIANNQAWGFSFRSNLGIEPCPMYISTYQRSPLVPILILGLTRGGNQFSISRSKIKCCIGFRKAFLSHCASLSMPSSLLGVSTHCWIAFCSSAIEACSGIITWVNVPADFNNK